jgi:diaminohydroxyphosphoribosylaminopyrimidine deaminase/5-amino-6-(5-phosphoribosylamino)uracil reductase
MDAILVGIGTALADDPQLTARPPGPCTAARIVLDSRCRLPPTSCLARTAREAPTLVATTGAAPGDAAAELQRLGCEVLQLPAVDGKPDVAALLAELGRRRFTNVLVEGGGGVFGSFFDAAAIDEVHVFVAPLLVGGSEAPTPVGGLGAARLADALRLAEWRVERVEADVYLHGWR